MEFLIIGSGIAGLSAALSLRENGNRVRVVSHPTQGSTYWAKGGIAAAVDMGDSSKIHSEDTERVCGGICEKDVVDYFTAKVLEAVTWLRGMGLSFDEDLRLEAGHSRRRILHVRDETGRYLWEFLMKRVMEMGIPTTQARVINIRRDQGGFVVSGRGGEFHTDRVVIATGGWGHLFSNSSNPPSAIGDGIAIAIRLGAVMSDPEFVQFHPTVSKYGGEVFLMTETLRGEGARLVNDRGEYFASRYDERGDLAPRDVLARAVYLEQAKGRRVYLDLSGVKGLQEKFPGVWSYLRRHGIDPRRVEVSAGSHYVMGGIATNRFGETTVPGIYCIGEAASTGLHGANRLASNSLAEGLVMGYQLGFRADSWDGISVDYEVLKLDSGTGHPSSLDQVKETNWKFLGVVRDRAGLREALSTYDRLSLSQSSPYGNQILVSTVMAHASLLREESRGSHFRADFPSESRGWKRRTFLSVRWA